MATWHPEYPSLISLKAEMKLTEAVNQMLLLRTRNLVGWGEAVTPKVIWRTVHGSYNRDGRGQQKSLDVPGIFLSRL